MSRSEYVQPNNFDLILNATNMVTTGVQSINSTVKVLELITDPSVTISQPFILKPHDPINFDVALERGSQMTINLSCTDDFFVSTIFYFQLSFTHLSEATRGIVNFRNLTSSLQ